MPVESSKPSAAAMDAAKRVAGICGMGAFDTALFDKLAAEIQQAFDRHLEAERQEVREVLRDLLGTVEQMLRDINSTMDRKKRCKNPDSRSSSMEYDHMFNTARDAAEALLKRLGE